MPDKNNIQNNTMKQSRTLLLIAAGIALFAAFSGCYRVQPNPGEESVLVYKPYIFGHGGVDPVPVSTGAEWCVFTTDHKELSLIHISEPTRQAEISYAVFC